MHTRVLCNKARAIAGTIYYRDASAATVNIFPREFYGDPPSPAPNFLERRISFWLEYFAFAVHRLETLAINLR